jgi:hypothetical protein
MEGLDEYPTGSPVSIYRFMCDDGRDPASPKMERISCPIVSRAIRGVWPLLSREFL